MNKKINFNIKFKIQKLLKLCFVFIFLISVFSFVDKSFAAQSQNRLETGFFEAYTNDIPCIDIQYDARVGSRDYFLNGNVMLLQTFLYQNEYMDYPPTGFFSTYTQQALLNFQRAKNLRTTGMLDLPTRILIASETCEDGKSSLVEKYLIKSEPEVAEEEPVDIPPVVVSPPPAPVSQGTNFNPYLWYATLGNGGLNSGGGNNGGNSGNNTQYTITFNLNGGTTTAQTTFTVSSGATFQAITANKGTSTLSGWYSDSSFTNLYNFSSAVYSSINLYAKWSDMSVNPSPPVSNALNFKISSSTNDANGNQAQRLIFTWNSPVSTTTRVWNYKFTISTSSDFSLPVTIESPSQGNSDTLDCKSSIYSNLTGTYNECWYLDIGSSTAKYYVKFEASPDDKLLATSTIIVNTDSVTRNIVLTSPILDINNTNSNDIEIQLTNVSSKARYANLRLYQLPDENNSIQSTRISNDGVNTNLTAKFFSLNPATQYIVKAYLEPNTLNLTDNILRYYNSATVTSGAVATAGDTWISLFATSTKVGGIFASTTVASNTPPTTIDIPKYATLTIRSIGYTGGNIVKQITTSNFSTDWAYNMTSHQASTTIFSQSILPNTTYYLTWEFATGSKYNIYYTKLIAFGSKDVLPQVQNFRMTEKATTTLTFSWDEIPDSKASFYQIDLKDQFNLDNGTRTIKTSGLTWTFDNLLEATPYLATITAIPANPILYSTSSATTSVGVTDGFQVTVASTSPIILEFPYLGDSTSFEIRYSTGTLFNNTGWPDTPPNKIILNKTNKYTDNSSNLVASLSNGKISLKYITLTPGQDYVFKIIPFDTVTNRLYEISQGTLQITVGDLATPVIEVGNLFVDQVASTSKPTFGYASGTLNITSTGAGIGGYRLYWGYVGSTTNNTLLRNATTPLPYNTNTSQSENTLCYLPSTAPANQFVYKDISGYTTTLKIKVAIQDILTNNSIGIGKFVFYVRSYNSDKSKLSNLSNKLEVFIRNDNTDTTLENTLYNEINNSNTTCTY